MENQWNSMTFSYQRKVKSYANWLKFLYLQVLFKLPLNSLTHHFHFPWLLAFFYFSMTSPGLEILFANSMTFPVFHDHTNPVSNLFTCPTIIVSDPCASYKHYSCSSLQFHCRWILGERNLYIHEIPRVLTQIKYCKQLWVQVFETYPKQGLNPNNKTQP